MINIERRKRQAHENFDTIITGIYGDIKNKRVLIEKQSEIRSLDELDDIIQEIEPKLLLLAQSLQPDWAIPIIIQAIGELYYGKYTQYSFVGNYFKRSLAYLWQNAGVPHGDYKNIGCLQELIGFCYVIETLYSFRKMFIAIPHFYLHFQNGHVFVPEEYHHEIMNFGALASGRGKRFRIAEINSSLMNELSTPFYAGLISVLNGKSPREIEIFKNTFYEEIPGIENVECSRFWKEVFCRYSLYLATLAQLDDSEDASSVIIFKEFAVLIEEIYLTQEIVENSFWKKDWFKNKIPECYGNLLVEKPIIRISPQGDFATSSVLIGDSLNWFVESQLLGYPTRNPYLNLPNKIFQNAFSQKFEDQCIELFRSHGFLSGHILETGVWKTQKENINLNIPDETLFGEIDVFACHPKLPIAFLVECKVLLDVQDSRSYQNIASKLKYDSEGFRFKLKEKAAWIQKTFNFHYGVELEPLALLVTDIPLPILGIDDEDITITDFAHMEYVLEYADDQIQSLSDALEG